MADLNKLTFREFTEARSSDGGGLRRRGFLGFSFSPNPVTDILHARDAIMVNKFGLACKPPQAAAWEIRQNKTLTTLTCNAAPS